MPFVSDKDFTQALSLQIVSPVNKDYQLRFNYWIDQFEAYYGDIVTFYKQMDTESKAERLIVINNLITELIQKQLTDEKSNLVKDSQSIGA
jgi:hypothetical protein